MILIADFASELRGSLPTIHSSRPNDLVIADIKHHSSTATALTQEATRPTGHGTAKTIESHGRDLWNLCIRLKRGAEQVDPKALIWARVFAFALLCLGRSSGRRKQDAESEMVYLMANALTLARLCMEAEETELAAGALHKAAELLDSLKKLTSGQPIERGRVKLEADYLAMRMALVNTLP